MNKVLEFFEKSRIHDYELKNIKVNYEKDIIIMEFKDEKKNQQEICIPYFISFSIFHNEEWGKGKYVISSDVYNIEGTFIVELQLNSGDKLIVECQSSL